MRLDPSARAIHVMIGIQARSTSQRLPNKVTAPLGDKTVIEWVIDSCVEARDYLLRNRRVRQCPEVTIVVLVPYGDTPLINLLRGRIPVIEGPEDDVLHRYSRAVNQYHPDYIIRITGDCPLIPSFVISKHINTIIMNNLDYVTNAYPGVRTTLDGWDCEALSKPLFRWALETATTPAHKEHVTTIIKEQKPDWARVGLIVNKLDLSSVKYSVDTEEDLERVREVVKSLQYKINQAAELGHIYEL